jgi:hypothetical protein
MRALKLAVIALCVLGSAPALAGMSCDLTRVSTLGGWPERDAQWWRGEFARAVKDRVGGFLRTGTFQPVTWQMHGNTASITSARIWLTEDNSLERLSEKRRLPETVPGTTIPTYSIVTEETPRQREITILVTDLVYRLPVDEQHLARIGAHSPVHVDAKCTLVGSASVAGYLARSK